MELVVGAPVAVIIGLFVAFSLSAVRLGAEADVRRIQPTQGGGSRSRGSGVTGDILALPVAGRRDVMV